MIWLLWAVVYIVIGVIVSAIVVNFMALNDEIDHPFDLFPVAFLFWPLVIVGTIVFIISILMYWIGISFRSWYKMIKDLVR